MKLMYLCLYFPPFISVHKIIYCLKLQEHKESSEVLVAHNVTKEWIKIMITERDKDYRKMGDREAKGS